MTPYLQEDQRDAIAGVDAIAAMPPR